MLDCLELILGTRPPDSGPGSEPLPITRQWLAERNLGLVPVADASGFDWPGHWIARVRTDGCDHAVVMFGSPSGPLYDPQGALVGDGRIVEGWLLARLDVHLPIDEPYGTARSTGSVAAILIAPAAEAPLVRVESANAVAGRGLEGDRYHEGRGTFSGPGRGYQLTLVEAEVLDELKLPWEEARRNIATRGIDLNALVGRRFGVGSVGASAVGLPSLVHILNECRAPACFVRWCTVRDFELTLSAAARSRSMTPWRPSTEGRERPLEGISAM